MSQNKASKLTPKQQEFLKLVGTKSKCVSLLSSLPTKEFGKVLENITSAANEIRNEREQKEKILNLAQTQLQEIAKSILSNQNLITSDDLRVALSGALDELGTQSPKANTSGNETSLPIEKNTQPNESIK